MNFMDVIDLSSDEDEGHADIGVKDFNFITASGRALRDEPVVKQVLEETRSPNSGSCVSEQVPSPGNLIPPPRPLCRQFWKSGDYELGRAVGPTGQRVKNRLRINPKFLHSNATSHKWAFGALAELLDNAIDEVHHGATFVGVDKFINPKDGSPALLIRDDGGGMDPESLRRCMSFGFSDKQSESFIGQYGNGFKTSTMRLGADVIVFSRCRKEKTLTQSVGFLSYTFLTQTGCDDIVVPTVDYEFDSVSRSYGRLLRQDEKQFVANLSVLLKWSPFSTEAELLKQFGDVGDHGTKIIAFNLWFNDDGDIELDFDSDPKDVLISGAHKTPKTSSVEKTLTTKNVARRLRYSLRAYASVLYLHLPENFGIILRGQGVEQHHVANDLIYRECILYKPQVGGIVEASVVTTIGFLKGAPNVDVQGMNVYHKNRLILPFWKVANNSYGKGRGVVGILEANFIKPTHDKQDFEKSTLYQKLENRLKEMTYEYWDLYCHLVGYDNKKLPRSVRQNPVGSLPRADTPPFSRVFPSSEASPASTCYFNTHKTNAQKEVPLKRKHDVLIVESDDSEEEAMSDTCEVKTKSKIQPERGPKQKRMNEIRAMVIENKKLQDQILQYEESRKQLILKEQKLRSQIEDAKREYRKILAELRPSEVKAEVS